MKSLGQVKSITLNISSPVAFKATEMEFSAITLLVGKNGVGKSFINVLVYAVTNLINFILIGKSTDAITDICDGMFKMCFDEIIVGEIKFNYSSGANIEIIFDETGKCIFVEYHNIDNLEPTKVIYMSSQFRLFTGIQMYLFIRKSIGGSLEEKVQKMCNTFRLYDVQTIEGMIMKMPFKFDENTIKSLNILSDNDETFNQIDKIDVDLIECDFIITMKDGTTKKAISLGSGHQAILNMCVTTHTNS